MNVNVFIYLLSHFHCTLLKCIWLIFQLWKFTQSRTIIRRDITNVVKIPSDEMKEMLEQVAKPKAKQGWVFKFEFDQDFVDK